MDFIVLICAILIGLSLGLFGSGGAILTLPMLIYVIGYEEKLAVITSLLIVAAISFIASIPNWKSRLINPKLLSVFVLPGLIGSYLGAYLGSQSEPLLQLLLLAIVIILAASKMLYFQPLENQLVKIHITKLALVGLIVGVITGFVGVGGGFLIVPALLIFGRLDFKRATATSLTLITIQSSVALYSYSQHASAIFVRVDWLFVVTFVFAGVLGTYLSAWLKPKLNQALLSKMFAYFLLLMASFILIDRFAALMI